MSRENPVARTAEDVWRLLGELTEKQKQAEDERKRLTAEVAESKKRTAAEVAESKKRADDERKRLDAEVAELKKQAEDERKSASLLYERVARRMKSLSEDMHKSNERLLKSLADKRNGNFNSKWGNVVEGLVESDLLQLLRKMNIVAHRCTLRPCVEDDNKKVLAECDASAVNGSQAVGVEVKTTLEKQDVDKFVTMLDTYAEDLFGSDKEIYGAMAFMMAEKDVQEYAIEKGLILIQAPKTDVEMSSLITPTNFKPRPFFKPAA